jgi:hypothetical protein
MGKPERITSRERVARRRAILRAQGLRPKQFWVPDTRSPDVQDEIRRACKTIASSARSGEDMIFAEAVQYWPPDDPD